ncbi:MAG: PAS domain S-box protein [Thermodesulfovibrionales bacterium]|jgi:PAS domain S-box-containing protein
MKTPEDPTKKELINDLIKLRQRINELEKKEEDKKNYVEKLNKTKAMFEGLFEFAPEAIVVVDREGRIMQVNKQTEKMFGYTREELIGADHDILLPERFREKHRELRREYMSDPHVRPTGTGMELYGRRKDGGEFPVDISLGPLHMEDYVVVLALVRDVTERRETERRLLKTKAELERSNKELEQFAYSVSHDLREPLGLIHGAIHLLSKKYVSKLDEEGRDYIRLVETSSERMKKLINALLDMSRFARGPLSRSKVNLSKLAKIVAADLAKNQPGRRVEFIIAENVSAEGDPALLRIVIENLMENAWKYSDKKPVARIELSVRLTDGETVYCIIDNGAGFDMEFANKLFAPFQRLHSEDEFPGLGIGLTTVQQIIDRHGGRIWAESEMNRGATFCFTL